VSSVEAERIAFRGKKVLGRILLYPEAQRPLAEAGCDQTVPLAKYPVRRAVIKLTVGADLKYGMRIGALNRYPTFLLHLPLITITTVTILSHPFGEVADDAVGVLLLRVHPPFPIRRLHLELRERHLFELWVRLALDRSDPLRGDLRAESRLLHPQLGAARDVFDGEVVKLWSDSSRSCVDEINLSIEVFSSLVG
jgi:hypothetical protein